jgi:hypothetical protein
MPIGGSETGQRLAFMWHDVVRTFRAASTLTGREMGCRWGFAPSTWSRAIHGDTWPSSVLVLAALSEIQEGNRDHLRP